MLISTTGTLSGDDAVRLNAIGMGGATLSTLNQLDNTDVVVVGPPQIGEAQIVDLGDPGALDDALLASLPSDVGADEINGGAGDDIIFGDVLNTDHLSSATFGAAGTHDGEGYVALIAHLEDDGAAGPISETAM